MFVWTNLIAFLFKQSGRLEDSLDQTWIVSAQAPAQKEIIADMAPLTPLYLEGSFRVWLKDKSISYFVLRADNPDQFKEEGEDEDEFDTTQIPINIYGKPKDKALAQQKDIHKQIDGIVLGICATGTSSRDSLLSWIRILERANPNLKNLQVIFTLKAPTSSLQTINESVVSQEQQDKTSEEVTKETNQGEKSSTRSGAADSPPPSSSPS